MPLKRLTQLCPSDLLTLLGMPDATVLSVETLELPASSTRLDNLLHVLEPGGQHGLHLVEWQGYKLDTLFWRMLYYLGWLGQNSPHRPIRCTIIYFTPEADAGDVLEQASQLAGG